MGLSWAIHGIMQSKELSTCLTHCEGSTNSDIIDWSNSYIERLPGPVPGWAACHTSLLSEELWPGLDALCHHLEILGTFSTRDLTSSLCTELHNLQRWSWRLLIIGNPLISNFLNSHLLYSSFLVKHGLSLHSLKRRSWNKDLGANGLLGDSLRKHNEGVGEWERKVKKGHINGRVSCGATRAQAYWGASETGNRYLRIVPSKKGRGVRGS